MGHFRPLLFGREEKFEIGRSLLPAVRSLSQSEGKFRK
jgi:hypothetical protein